jgi:outer membrane receptor protein involved in Fe transport
MGPWSAGWTVKYIGRYVVGYASPLANISADGAIPQYQLFEGASVYHNVTVGYNIEALNTRIDVGIDNLSDKQPQILSQTNTLNGNVDVNTFDTVGRYYFARVSVKF